MTVADLERMGRWRRTVQTWIAKAAWTLAREGGRATTDERRWLVGYEAGQLLQGALGELLDLVPLLAEDQIEEVETKARELAAAIRRHRLSRSLLRVDGRTPTEADAFRQKALSLGAPR